MPRREFSKATRRAALARSGHRCEGEREPGIRCDAPVGNSRPVEFDHVIPDWMGGEATLENCAALCRLCHRDKTARDAADRGKARRREDCHNGIKDPHRRRMQGRGFEPPPPQHSATRRVEKLQIAYSPERIR